MYHKHDQKQMLWDVKKGTSYANIQFVNTLDVLMQVVVLELV
jgi:hypothetical protein